MDNETKNLEVSFTDKWIILTHDGKEMKTRRKSNQGILLESLFNNPDGVNKFVLELALELKNPVPTMDQQTQDGLEKLIKQHGVKNLTSFTEWVLKN